MTFCMTNGAKTAWIARKTGATRNFVVLADHERSSQAIFAKPPRSRWASEHSEAIEVTRNASKRFKLA